MKAKVIRAFIDKGTNAAHKFNEIVELKKERFIELKEKGFVVEDYSDQKAEVNALEKENTELKAQIVALTAENTELKAIIEKAAEKPIK